MNRRVFRLLLCVGCLALLQRETPAPFVYRPGEGWTYESPGSGGKWVRNRAKDQLEVAQAAFDQKDISTALKAARRTVSVWPLSDYSPQAQYLVARCKEAQGKDEIAFKEYQKLLEKYPKISNYEEILQREFTIANRFLGGQWYKLWGYVPIGPSMEKTAGLYEKLIKSGPYSEVAPLSQINIGQAWEHQFKPDYPKAVKAYELAADRYHDQKKLASDAAFKAGEAYLKQASRAEYDQSIAGRAIATFSDFNTLYPEDPRVSDAKKEIVALREEQARGNFMVAEFYEKRKRWQGALVYYGEVVRTDPNSKYAEQAKQRIEVLQKRVAPRQTAQN